MRKSFALLTAIIFLITITTIGTLSLYLSATSVKHTSDVYLREQAELLAISATEHAILALQAHDFSIPKGKTQANCLEKINSVYPDNSLTQLDINVSIKYIANDLNCSKAGLVLNSNKAKYINDNNSTKPSNETYKVAIIDTIVSTHDGVTSTKIRFHKRTAQSLNYDKGRIDSFGGLKFK